MGLIILLLAIKNADWKGHVPLKKPSRTNGVCVLVYVCLCMCVWRRINKFNGDLKFFYNLVSCFLH